MKKFFLSLFMMTFILGMSESIFAQLEEKTPDPRKWNIDPRMTQIYSSGEKTEYDEISLNFINPNKTTSVYNTKVGKVLVSPNFRVHPSANTQSEVPITRHPTNPLIMFGSSNSVQASPFFISEGVYVTTDGGTTWFGNDTTLASPLTNHGGDPAPAIDHTGRFYQSYLGYTTEGMFASYSTNNGSTWANTYTIVTGSQDKNHTFINDVPSSPYYGRVYVTWSLFTATNPPAVVAYSTNQGVSFTAPINVHAVASGHYAQGVNGAIAPNGDAYITWQSPVAASPYTGDFLGFAKSTNGGSTWTYNNNIYDCNGIRGTLTNKASIRVNDFPWMGVDRSGGPRNGWIYIATGEKNLAPAGSDPDIILHRSTDGGTTWSAGVRVNQDGLNNGKDQYMPCLHVDNFGGVNIVYYDSRNTANDSAEVYISRSVDGGFTFTDILVSDHRFKPKPITGLAGGYQGDYIGLTSQGTNLWPLWADDFSGRYQAWTTKVTIADYPLNAFNLISPTANVVLTSFPNTSTPYVFNWDTSASTASYKWIFGNPTTTPRKLTLYSPTNSLTITSGQLDALLASLGVAPGDSLVGQWDVWAYRNNPPSFDSLKSTNGPRAITLKRGIPSLLPFSLLNPLDNSRIVTSVFNNGPININWRKSGDGVTYKWKYGTNVITTPLLTYTSNNSGFDTTLNFVNSGLDLIIGGIGLAPGDSIVGQWAVWAYNGLDSLKSSETFGLTLKRQSKGDVLIAYDSTSAACRTSRDSISYYLNARSVTFDLFNKGTQTSLNVITYRGYKTIIWLGEGTSVMSNIQKDSIKAYLNNPTVGQKSKLILFAEDVGYQFGRTGSTYLDLNFMNQYLGANFVLDRPSSGGNQGLVGLYVNAGKTDSTVGTWPDVLSRFDPPTTYELYKFRVDNSINAIGKISTLFNIATFGVDIESLRRANDNPTGSSIQRFIYGALDFVDEVSALKTLNLTTLIEGFYNGTTSVLDTINVELRNTTSPYALLESKKVVLNTSGTGIGSFSSVADGTPFYIVLKHRNALETWSATGKSFTSNLLSYDFTTDSAKAFGNNMIKKGSKWCLYSSDVNQDGSVDLLDLIDIDNDAYNFITGYVRTDVNGDGAVDLLDLIIGDNNAYNFVTVMRPSLLMKKSSLKRVIDLKPETEK